MADGFVCGHIFVNLFYPLAMNSIGSTFCGLVRAGGVNASHEDITEDKAVNAALCQRKINLKSGIAL